MACAASVIIAGYKLYQCLASSEAASPDSSRGDFAEAQIPGLAQLLEPPAVREYVGLRDGNLSDEVHVSEDGPGRCRMPLCEKLASFGFLHSNSCIVHGVCKEHAAEYAASHNRRCPFCQVDFDSIVRIFPA